MKYDITTTNRYRKSIKKIKFYKRKYQKVQGILLLLETGGVISYKNRDHQLHGDMKDYREIHVGPDLLLVYEKDVKERLITLINIGSHSELF